MLAQASQFEILHFAGDPLTAAFEIGALLGNYVPGGWIPHPSVTLTVLNVQIILHTVADLTAVASAQAPLGITAEELTGDWDGYMSRNPRTPVTEPTGIAPTQELGAALFRTGIEGFRSVSAKVPFARTLMVFPENLQPGSSLTYRDDTGAVVHSIIP